jgi:hypothetical protein
VWNWDPTLSKLLDMDLHTKFFSYQANLGINWQYRLGLLFLCSESTQQGWFAIWKPLMQSSYSNHMGAVRTEKGADGWEVDARATFSARRRLVRSPHWLGTECGKDVSGWWCLVQIMCEVSIEDIAEHVRDRLQKEHEEKERKRMEKLEAHLFTFFRIATDKDLSEQIGTDRYFDLVDHDKVSFINRLPAFWRCVWAAYFLGRNKFSKFFGGCGSGGVQGPLPNSLPLPPPRPPSLALWINLCVHHLSVFLSIYLSILSIHV